MQFVKGMIKSQYVWLNVEHIVWIEDFDLTEPKTFCRVRDVSAVIATKDARVILMDKVLARSDVNSEELP